MAVHAVDRDEVDGVDGAAEVEVEAGRQQSRVVWVLDRRPGQVAQKIVTSQYGVKEFTKFTSQYGDIRRVFLLHLFTGINVTSKRRGIPFGNRYKRRKLTSV